MKKQEVPQDPGSLDTKNISELCYAVDENGQYTTVQSKGWEVKSIALEESLNLIEERVEANKQAYLDGELSPIPYYMELNRMDLPLLASYVGIHRWFVKRHFKPSVFRKLKNSTMEKYAAVFSITVEQFIRPFEK
jgi:hypothetical protein